MTFSQFIHKLELKKIGVCETSNSSCRRGKIENIIGCQLQLNLLSIGKVLLFHIVTSNQLLIKVELENLTEFLQRNFFTLSRSHWINCLVQNSQIKRSKIAKRLHYAHFAQACQNFFGRGCFRTPCCKNALTLYPLLSIQTILSYFLPYYNSRL